MDNDENDVLDVFAPEEEDDSNGQPADEGAPPVEDGAASDEQDDAGAPAPAPVFDPAAVTKAIQEGFSSLGTKPGEPPVKEPTPEELAKLLNVWDPDDSFGTAFATAITDSEATPASRKQAFLALRDGLMRQASTYAYHLAQVQQRQLTEQFAPVMEFVREQQVQRVRGNFLKEFPAFKGYEEVLGLVGRNLSETGFVPKSQGEANKKLAEEAGKLIQRLNPSFNYQSKAKPSGGGAPSMAKVSTGNQGGSGGAPSKKTAEVDIWS